MRVAIDLEAGDWRVLQEFLGTKTKKATAEEALRRYIEVADRKKLALSGQPPKANSLD